MAAPSGEGGDGGAARYCLVSGIPAALRSAHLRSYFSQFLEAGGFLCFHYRHRPERPAAGGGGGASAARSCCCLVSVRPGRARRFVRMYSGKRWLGPGGSALPGRCLIRRVRPSAGAGPPAAPSSQEEHGGCVTEAELRRLPELNPPSFLPFGNVGTPLSALLQLIRACRLPPPVIRKLQLDFPRTGSSRRYGNVPFQYHGTETVAEEERVYTAAGDEIMEGEEPVTQPARPGQDEEEQQQEEEESHSDDTSMSRQPTTGTWT